MGAQSPRLRYPDLPASDDGLAGGIGRGDNSAVMISGDERAGGNGGNTSVDFSALPNITVVEE